MRHGRIFWGVFLLTLGGLILANNFVGLDYDWEFMLKLWPLALIIFGLYFVIKDSRYRWIFVAASALVISFAVFSAFYGVFSFFNGNFDDGEFLVQTYEEPYSPAIQTAKLSFEAAAGNFKMLDTTGSLVTINTKGGFGNYDFHVDKSEKHSDVVMDLQDNHVEFHGGFPKNKVDIKLNRLPVWDMDFDIGAASMDLDLSPYRTGEINLKSGASSIKIRLGDKSNDTKLSFEGGASSIVVLIPESSGCEINSETKLSSRNYNGFKKISKGLYRTENFDSAGKKIFLSFETGVSSVKVDRY